MPDVLVNNIRLHYEVRGEGEPLLLAHGLGATGDMWAPQVEAFSRKYRFITYDLRGHGCSEAPHNWTGYTLDDYVEDQLQLMDHLDIDTAYVGGLSMGGAIAVDFALAHPERLKALLLCDTSARNYALQGKDTPRSGVRASMRKFALSEVFPRTVILARHLPLERLPQKYNRKESIDSYMESLRGQSACGFRGAWHALMGQPNLEDRLGEISVPTLIIVGDHDPLLTPSRAMQERIPGCRFVLIKDSTHGTSGAQPEAFTKAVLDFLADVEAGRPVAGETSLSDSDLSPTPADVPA